MFVGKVETVEGTVYHGGSQMPYTVYTVSVQQNLKGELPADTPVILQKIGGVSRSKLTCSLFEDDIMPETGSTYLFAAQVTDGGELLAGAPNTAVPFTSEEQITFYQDAIANQITDGHIAELRQDRNHVYGQTKE